MKLCKTATVKEPTPCAYSQDTSIQGTQFEGTKLGQVTDTGSWDVESPHW